MQLCVYYFPRALLSVFTEVKCSGVSKVHQSVDLVFVIEMQKSWFGPFQFDARLMSVVHLTMFYKGVAQCVSRFARQD